MKRFALLGLLVLALAGGCAKKDVPPPATDSGYFNKKMSQLAIDITSNSSRQVRKAAVMDFVNAGGSTSQLGRYVTNKFQAIVVERKLFQTPSKGQVTEALNKTGVNYNGTLDAASAKKLADELGVSALIVGIISDLQKGSDIDLLVQMIDARSGNVISAASTSFRRSKSVSTLFESP